MNAVVYSGMAAEPIDKTLQCLLAVWLLKGVPDGLIAHFQGRSGGGHGSVLPVAMGTLTRSEPSFRSTDGSESSIHPVARGTATVAAIAGTMLADNLIPLFVVWIVVLIPFSIAAGTIKKHAAVLGSVILPLCLMLGGVWGWLVGAPPGLPTGSDPMGGLRYAALIALQLTVFAAVFQLCFLTIPQSQLLVTFWHWGIRKDNLIVAIGAFTVWPELKLRAEQILTARHARGLMRDRRFSTRLRQIPFLLRPLLTWSLRAAIQRSEFWGQRQILSRVAQMRHQGGSSLPANLLTAGAAIIWLGYNAVARL